MLPLIVIGADSVVGQAFQNCVVPIQPVVFYVDSEAATNALNDALLDAVQSGVHPAGMVEFDDDRQAWIANVAYGPESFCLATIAKPVRLAHTGWTLVLAHGIKSNDPGVPRRVVDGTPEGRDQSTVVWQAAPMLQAQVVVDVESQGALDAVLTAIHERLEP